MHGHDEFPSSRFLSSHKSRSSISKLSLPHPSPSPPPPRKKHDSLGSTSSRSSAFSNLPQYQDNAGMEKEKEVRAVSPAPPPYIGPEPAPNEAECTTSRGGMKEVSPRIGGHTIRVTGHGEPSSRRRQLRPTLPSPFQTLSPLPAPPDMSTDEAGEEAAEDDDDDLPSPTSTDPLDILILRSSSILASATSILSSTRSSRAYFQRFNSLEDSLSLSLFDREHSLRTQLQWSEDLEGRTDDLGKQVERFGAKTKEESSKRNADHEELLRVVEDEKERERKEREEAKDPRNVWSASLVGTNTGAGLVDNTMRGSGLGKGRPPQVSTLRLSSEETDKLFDLASASPPPRPTRHTSSASVDIGTSSTKALSSLLQQADSMASAVSSSRSPAIVPRRASTSAIALLSSFQSPSSPSSQDKAERRRPSHVPSPSPTPTSTSSSSLLSPQFSSSSFGFSTINENDTVQTISTPPSSRPSSPSPTPSPIFFSPTKAPQTSSLPITPKHLRTISSPPTLTSPTLSTPTSTTRATTTIPDRPSSATRRVSVTSLAKANIGELDKTHAVAGKGHGRSDSALKETLERMKGAGGGNGASGEGVEDGKGWWWR